MSKYTTYITEHCKCKKCLDVIHEVIGKGCIKTEYFVAGTYYGTQMEFWAEYKDELYEKLCCDVRMVFDSMWDEDNQNIEIFSHKWGKRDLEIKKEMDEFNKRMAEHLSYDQKAEELKKFQGPIIIGNTENPFIYDVNGLRERE